MCENLHAILFLFVKVTLPIKKLVCEKFLKCAISSGREKVSD